MAGRGAYADSQEELTPVRVDWLRAVPLVMAALILLMRPGSAHTLPRWGFGAHLLSARSVKLIESEIAAQCSNS